MHFHTGLRTKINNFNTYLKGVGTVNGRTIPNHDGYDNRISVNNADEYKLATNAGYADNNEDGYIDEYDLFLAQFDLNKDKRVSKAEFTVPSTTRLYDEELFTMIDRIGAPRPKEDRDSDG